MPPRPRAGRPGRAAPASTLVSLVLLAVSTLGPAACDDALRADGSPCETPFVCASGACLAHADGSRRCAHRCASPSACAAGEVCGRFDFRGRDDAGIPAGFESDVLRACRAPLNRPCAQGCGDGEVCSGDGGVCVSVCTDAVACGGHACVRDGCASGACAIPCDDNADCPTAWRCDTTRLDARGHGECISAQTTPAPPRDGGCAAP